MGRLAYPFPFQSVTLGALEHCTDAELRSWSIGRVRDQAVAVDMEAYRTDGRLQELTTAIAMLDQLCALAEQGGEWQTHQGLCMHLDVYHTERARTEEVRGWMQGLQDWLRAILRSFNFFQDGRTIEDVELEGQRLPQASLR